MATQLERRNSTRQALLDAAAQCLQEQGVGGFTTVEVVRRSELSNGALFRYFPSRSELLAATVAHIFEKLRFDYERAYSSIPRSQASIQTMLELLWKVMNDPALGSIYEIYTT